MRPATSQGFYLHHLPYYALLSQVFGGARLLQLGGGAFTARYAEHLGGIVTCGLSSAREAAHNQSIHRNSEVEFIDVRLPTLPFIDNAFDIVMAFDVTADLDDPRAFLSEVRRVLTPGGFALFTLPNFRRDDLQEVMGEVSRQIPAQNSAEIYAHIAKLFPFISSVTQTPFMGYMMAEQHFDGHPRAFNLGYELVESQPEAPLYLSFLASDLEIVLEEDRLIQVPFSHLVDRLQGGLRTYHRVLERKTNALLDLRAEIKHLQSDQDELEARARQAEKRNLTLENTIEKALELLHSQRPASSDDGAQKAWLEGLIHRLENTEPSPMPTTPLGGPSPKPLSEGSFGVSTNEMRLLMEGLQGGDIDEEMSALGDAVAPTDMPELNPETQRRVQDLLADDTVFQEDLTPFQLPGPVPLAKALRSELQHQRNLLAQREAQLRAIEGWRLKLLNILGETLDQVDEHVAQLRHWNRIDPLTQSWEQFAQLLTELTTAAVNDKRQDHWELEKRHAAAITVEKLQDQIVDLESRLTQTLQDDAILRRELGRTDEEIHQLNQARQELQGHIEALNIHVEQLRTDNTELRVKLAQAHEKYEEWQGMLDGKERQLKALSLQLDGLARQSAEAEKRAHADLQSERESAQAALEAQRAISRESLESAQNKAKDAVDTARAKALAESSELKRQLLDIEDQRDRLKRQLDDSERAQVRAESELDVGKQAVSTLRAELQTALKAEAALRASLDASQLSETALNSELSSLRQNQLELRTELSTTLESLENAQKQLLDSRGRVSDLQETLDGSLRARRSLQNQVDGLEDEVKGLSSKNDDLVNEKNALENTLSQTKEHMEGARAQAEATQSELHQKLEAAQTQLDAQGQNLSESPTEEVAIATATPGELEALRTQLITLTREKVELERVASAAKIAVRESRASRESALRENKALKAALDAAQSDGSAGQSTPLPEARSLFEPLIKRIQRTLATGEPPSDFSADIDGAVKERLGEQWSTYLQRLFNESERLIEGFSKQLQKNNDLDKDRIALKQERDQAAMQQRALEEQLKIGNPEHKSEIERLKRELRDTTNERQNLERSLAKAREEKARAINTPDGEQITHLQSELAQTQEALAQAHQALEAHDEEMVELKDEIQRAWSRALNRDGPASVTEAETLAPAQPPALQDSDQELLARVHSLEKELETRDLQYTRLQKELALKSTHNRNLQEMIGRQRDELKRIKTKVKQALAYIEVLRARQGLRGTPIDLDGDENMDFDY